MGGLPADGIDLVTPILVLDQFEELFTLGRQGTGADERRGRFLDELAGLVENRPPQYIREQVLADPALSREYDFSRARFRLLFSLREDFLPDFEGLLGQMPSLRLHRMRLLAMDGREALAVVQGGGEIVAPEVAERLVRFVAADKGGRSLEELAVEPSLLSLVCRELNQRRLDQGRPVIDIGLLSGAREEILSEFYTRCLADQPPALAELIEERLLSESGYRNDMVLEDALALPGVTLEAINRLIERRLLRLEERSGRVRVELTHDLLTAVARDCRQRRRQAAARAEAARQLAQNRRRMRLMGAAAFAMLLLVVMMATLSWKMYEAQQQAQRANEEAIQARNEALESQELALKARDDAEELIGFMTTTLRDQLLPIGQIQLLSQLNERVSRYYEQRSDDLALAALTPGEQQSLARNLYNQAEIFALADDLTAAGRLYREGQQLLERLLRDHPDHPQSGEWRYLLAEGRRLLGDLAYQDDAPEVKDEAISHYQAAAEQMAELLAQTDAGKNPHWLFESMRIDSALAGLAEESVRARHRQQALAGFARIGQLDRAIWARQTADAPFWQLSHARFLLIFGQAEAGWASAVSEPPEMAADIFRAAVAVLQGHVDQDRRHRQELMRAWLRLAEVAEGAEATRAWQEAYAIKTRLKEEEGLLLPFDEDFRRDFVQNRYEFRGDQEEIVFDRATRLEWQRCSVGQNWNPDRQSCEGEAAEFTWDEAVELTAPGGFQLPTIEELRSLVYCSSGVPVRVGMGMDGVRCGGEYGRPTIFGAAFTNTRSLGSWFWSSSPNANNAYYAWYVNFHYGNVSNGLKGSSNRVRLVRAGQ